MTDKSEDQLTLFRFNILSSSDDLLEEFFYALIQKLTSFFILAKIFTEPIKNKVYLSMYTGIKTYKDIDATLLKGIPNPSEQAYEIKTKIPEFTFLGVKEQPDFATIYLTFYPNKKIIELKSLKHYVFQLRNIIVSYERLINIIYDDLQKVYEPERLRIVMICNPRGGISSKLTIDSDWKARGGKEVFNDWQRIEDEWEVTM